MRNHKASSLLTVLFAAAVAITASTLVVGQDNGADKWSRNELKHAIANAKTPGDHLKIALYFDAEADRLEAEAKDHEELAEVYRDSSASRASAMKNPMAGNTAAHCEYFAKAAREAAKADRELGAVHSELAKRAGSPKIP